MMDSVVAIRKCSEYNLEEVQGHIKWLYEEATGPDPSGKKVLVKPNIISDVSPDKAVSTHPVVVEAVIRYLQSRGATILVGDSPTFDNRLFTGKLSGIRQVTENCGAHWVRFNKSSIKKTVGSGLLEITDLVDEVDLIISLPKMKNHELMIFTGAIKNIFGLVPGFTKVFQHLKFKDKYGLAGFLLDLEEVLRPQFHIMDGIVAMEGPGPGNGFPKKAGILLASSNPLALDIAASTIAGYDPMSVPTNKIALERKKLLRKVDDIIYKGPEPESLIIRDFKRITTGGEAGIIFKNFRSKLPLFLRLDRRPVFNSDLCISCLKCVKVCPVKALKLHEKKKNTIIINDKICIQCYCCQEVCLDRAIEIRRKFVGRW